MEISTISFSHLAIGAIALYILKLILGSKKGAAPLPPGPKPLPIIGNVNDLPSAGDQEWLHWLKHKDLYGPISSVTVLGQTLVILNDAEVATDLLDKRSAVYSSRPRMVFGGEMIGWVDSLVGIPYNARFHAYRKNIHRFMGTKTVLSRFFPVLDVEARRFLFRTLENPEEFRDYIRVEAGAVILKLVYGYTVEPHKPDPFVELADNALGQFSETAVPGAWIVDTIPFLRYFPSWLPGMGFKTTAEKWRGTLVDFLERPYALAKKRINQGMGQDSFISAFLENNEVKPGSEEEFVAKWSTASIYGGGADTTVSSMACFFLAMILYPEVSRKAQEEIDLVIGTDRLPTLDDRESLPYVDAIVKETLRWHPVGPCGVPHMSTADDIYNGYLIPKGSILIANVWAFTHNPKTYHDPMTFKPERFLEAEGQTPELDPHTISFGNGRRICPGRVLADVQLFLNIAQSLAVFNIGKGVENGKEVDPVVHFGGSIISHPAPYKISIKPRSPKHEEIIRSVETLHPWEESDAKLFESLKS